MFHRTRIIPQIQGARIGLTQDIDDRQLKACRDGRQVYKNSFAGLHVFDNKFISKVLFHRTRIIPQIQVARIGLTVPTSGLHVRMLVLKNVIYL